ncbi:hypothetical protein ACFL3Q_00125 [Planctomycetota bacterium]
MERESFEFFLRNGVQENPSLNLEDALNQYITKYGLAVRYNLDEPVVVTDARTKLHILEDSPVTDLQDYTPDGKFQEYLAMLRRSVKMYNSLSPELLKRMKEKEQSESKAEFGSKNRIVTKEKYAEIMARHATNPIFQWLDRSSSGYWASVSHVADYFSKSIRRVRTNNRFVTIALRTFVLVTGFIIVTPLYMVIGPVVQVTIIIIAVVWACLAGVFGWHRSSQ